MGKAIALLMLVSVFGQGPPRWTVAILYYATSNAKEPKFRWISVGALVAIIVWALLSGAFGFYVSNTRHQHLACL